MSHCPLLMENHIFNDEVSLNLVILIRTVSNLFTMLSAEMSFLCFNIINIGILRQELVPIFQDILPMFSLFTSNRFKWSLMIPRYNA